jgi:hypothetical protein
MAHASKKHFGPGTRGKHDGSGGETEVPVEKIGENMVLSNRDKAQHSRERGQDRKQVQTDQLQDHASNRLADE